MLNEINQKLDQLLKEMDQIATNAMIVLVQDILQKHLELYEFDIGRDGYEFTFEKRDHCGSHIVVSTDDDIYTKYLNEIAEFILKWDDILHLTTKSMKITANSVIRHNY